MFDPNQPYNDLPKLPVAAEVETRPVLKRVLTLERKSRKLEAAILQLPDRAIMIDSFILEEAKDSSEIENIITTHDELYEAAYSAKIVTDPNLKEVLHYKKALFYGIDFVDKNGIITTNLLETIANIINENNAGIRKIPGTALQNDQTKEVVYTPPFGEGLIRDLLANLESFINLDEDGLDLLVKMAIIHYQFEAIHPFTDGNGRTGRILIILYLYLKKFIISPAIFMSKFILEDKGNYYQKLRNVTNQGDWAAFIIYMFNKLEMTLDHTIRASNQINEYISRVFAEDESRQWPPGLKNLMGKMYLKINDLVESGIGNRITAAKYLKLLEKDGWLRSQKMGKEVLYFNIGLGKILVDKTYR